MTNNFKKVPRTIPQSDRWYNLALGSSFKDESSNKYFTLHYEFQPASVDKTKPGLLRKTKENRVSMEFQNNQIEKPKVTFEGSSEEYKETDVVLFFDGETFRLEWFYKVVKQLQYLRLPGESTAAVAVPVAAPSAPALEIPSAPIGKHIKPPTSSRSLVQPVSFH